MNVANVVNQKNEDIGQEIFEFFANGGCYRDLKDVDDDTMEAIYYVAYNLYQNEKYEDSLKVFKFLGLFDHLNKKYFMGLAACQQMLQQYKDAINSYSFAAVLDVYDPIAPLHAGECYLALGDFEQAINGFNAAIEFSERKAGNEEVQIKAEKMLNIVKSKLA